MIGWLLHALGLVLAVLGALSVLASLAIVAGAVVAYRRAGRLL